MDPEVASLVAHVKGDGRLELNVKVSQIMSILKAHGLMNEALLHSREILIHPQNRAGKMCVPAEVHAKGDKLLKTGADLSRLDGICFEVASDPQKRNVQLQANRDLQEQSEGKLAKVVGNERYLSVSGSHTVAFVKSVSEQCVTEEPGLLDLCPGGQLSLEALVSGSSIPLADHPFTQMVKMGWTWKIIKQEVEVQFPDLPALVQQAQNSSHALATQMNEVEAAMQIAYWFKQCQSMAEAVKLTMASQPACAHYLDCIGRYVRLYGGGSDFPIISVLDGVCALLGLIAHDSVAYSQAHISMACVVAAAFRGSCSMNQTPCQYPISSA